MKLSALLATVCTALVFTPFVFGSDLPQAAAYHIMGKPQAIVPWSQIVSADRLAPTSPSGTFRVVPSPGRGLAPQPMFSGSVGPQESGASLTSAGVGGGGENRATAVTSGLPALSFQALSDNDKVIPPDTYGAVGPSHVMTMLNSQVRIQDKSGSTISTVALSSFWSPLPSSSATFDPRVQYDAIHGRWIASCGTNADSVASKINLAISSTSDPTGTWTFYQLPADTLESGPSCWADYPCLGFNGKWIVITANMYTIGGSGTFKGARMWVIDASTVLSGGSIGYKLFLTKFDVAGSVNGFTLQPCVTYGAGDTLFVVDNSGYYASSDTTFLLRLSRIIGTAANPAWSVVPNSSFTGTGLFRVTSNFNKAQIDASQLGSSTLISTNDSRIISAVYRGGRIWCTHSGGLPAKIALAANRTAVFWYHLNPLVMPNPIVQSGVLDGGTGSHYFFPSIAANAHGDACLGFTRSDASRYAEAVFSGRLQTDPAGTMQTVQLLKAGESSYSKFFGGSENRWGDYSNTCVDPSDDLTFWTIQEYAAQNVGSGVNDGRWGTWWGNIAPPSSLPIQLSSFTVLGEGTGTVRLEWTTLSEIDNFGFEVEKSTEATGPYSTIPQSFTPGHGTTVAPHNYSFTDNSVTAGEWWYRLKQTDLNGFIHYYDPAAVILTTGVATATAPLESALLQNYPNPFNPKTGVRFQVAGVSNVRLSVYDILGREVKVLVNERKQVGRYEVSFDGSGLASGVYIYRLTAGTFVQSRRMVLTK
jgi:hypothetical protein